MFMMACTPVCECVCVYAGSLSGHITKQSTVMWLVCLSCVGGRSRQLETGPVIGYFSPECSSEK